MSIETTNEHLDKCPSCGAELVINKRGNSIESNEQKVPEAELVPSDNKGVLLTLTLPGSNLTEDDCLKTIKELNDTLAPETE